MKVETTRRRALRGVRGKRGEGEAIEKGKDEGGRVSGRREERERGGGEIEWKGGREGGKEGERESARARARERGKHLKQTKNTPSKKKTQRTTISSLTSPLKEEEVRGHSKRMQEPLRARRLQSMSITRSKNIAVKAGKVREKEREREGERIGRGRGRERGRERERDRKKRNERRTKRKEWRKGRRAPSSYLDK